MAIGTIKPGYNPFITLPSGRTIAKSRIVEVSFHTKEDGEHSIILETKDGKESFSTFDKGVINTLTNEFGVDFYPGVVYYPFQFGTGDGTETQFHLVGPDGPIYDATNKIIYVDDWQGRNRLYSTARSNLVTYSEEMDQWNTTSSGTGSADPTVTADDTTAPDGTSTADLVEFDAGSAGTGYSYIESGNIELTDDLQVVSFWAKTSTNTDKIIRAEINGEGGNMAITPNWTRHYINISLTATLTSSLLIGMFNEQNTSADGGVYIWGVQVESVAP